jgi:hypothetical protein
VAAVVDAFVAREEQLADPVERVAAAAPVAEGLVLCTRRRTSSRHRLATRTTWNGSVTRRAWSSLGDSPARNDSARSVATTWMAPSHAGSALFVHRRRSAAALPSTMSISIRRSRSTMPVANTVARWRVALRNDVSSIPRWRTRPTRRGSSTSGVPCSTTAFMTVHQHTPSSSATLLTGRASSPTCRHASAPARRVSTTWASRCSEVSVQVLRSHAGSGQRHRRLRHTSRAGRPKHGRSRMAVGRRSCATARVPQPAHASTSMIVSTSTTSSHGVSTTSSTRKPGSPRSASARPVPSFTQGPFSSSQPSAAVTMAGPLPHVVDPRSPTSDRRPPYSNAKSQLTRRWMIRTSFQYRTRRADEGTNLDQFSPVRRGGRSAGRHRRGAPRRLDHGPTASAPTRSEESGNFALVWLEAGLAPWPTGSRCGG